ANIPIFGGPGEGWEVYHGEGSLADRLVEALTLLLVDLKFISLLSILFGAGLELQSQRADAAGRPFVRYYLWRQFLLLLIGLAHGVLLWFGDILTGYAFLGAAALLFVRLFRGRGLVWSAAVCFAVFFAWLGVIVVVAEWLGPSLGAPPEPVAL